MTSQAPSTSSCPSRPQDPPDHPHPAQAAADTQQLALGIVYAYANHIGARPKQCDVNCCITLCCTLIALHSF
ncbi:hypothetical protein PtB15_8B137 [Puccinia triticina]|nr:hypothetical protein PtB15_8B137 [Puccinia triticina]